MHGASLGRRRNSGRVDGELAGNLWVLLSGLQLLAVAFLTVMVTVVEVVVVVVALNKPAKMDGVWVIFGYLHTLQQF